MTDFKEVLMSINKLCFNLDYRAAEALLPELGGSAQDTYQHRIFHSFEYRVYAAMARQLEKGLYQRYNRMQSEFRFIVQKESPFAMLMQDTYTLPYLIKDEIFEEGILVFQEEASSVLGYYDLCHTAVWNLDMYRIDNTPDMMKVSTLYQHGFLVHALGDHGKATGMFSEARSLFEERVADEANLGTLMYTQGAIMFQDLKHPLAKEWLDKAQETIKSATEPAVRKVCSQQLDEVKAKYISMNN
ncbi:MAG: hypothetical protein HGA85_06175 [Nanoarchaeota archaeon]|nr:hypothetical protein [Nanoarchaeota archaeon]